MKKDMKDKINKETAGGSEEKGLFQSRKRTFVSDIERGIYDIKDKVDYRYSTGVGLNEDVVKKISERKKEPAWMLDFKTAILKAF